MLHKLYVLISSYSPRLRKRAFRMAYDTLSRVFLADQPVTFLNYGYADEHTPAFRETLEPDDREDHLSIRLYARLLDGIPIAGKRVLDIGCGRGGGASYIARYLRPASVIGIDYSARSIAFCEGHHQAGNLEFRVGDAENLQIEPGSIDVMLNVETSHCYRDVMAFLANARRVLAPNGVLCFCDVRPADRVEQLIAELDNCGLRQVWFSDISDNVLLALREGSESRSRMVRRTFPRLLQRSAVDWAGVEGGTVEHSFAEGTRRYIACVMQNPGQ